MIDRLRPFAINGLRVLLVDRGVLFVDFFIATGVAFLIQFFVWSAVYGAHEEIHGFTLEKLLYYSAFTIYLSRLNNCYDLVQEISEEIIEGRLETQLARPVSYIGQKFAAYLGGGVLYAIPVLILCIVYWLNNPERLSQSPAELVGYGLLIISFLLAGAVLSFCIGIFLGILTFWLMQPDFVLACLTTITAFLGGAIIPPSYWPEFIHPLMAFNPFQYFIAAPATLILSGDVPAGAVALGIATLYILLFMFVIKVMWRRAIDTYTGGGG
ncbi:ABC-2 family transporter protein [Burkholderia ambifaria]|uniref:ABC-2 family transporter protein n=1 Tax=Burkholderia ambifaria TaxID=152480 RepID=A0AA41JGS0_9BURK|nr:ABC-2 family transporter protein [Burkholderia ambifaria]MBR8127420.1 ABC-2 family transporter protein [Burkholderia ambifaria]PRD95963.1 ABC transporter permease [Burkholderia ambifaria]